MWLSKKSLQRPMFQPKSPWNHAVLKIHQLLHQTAMHCYGPVWFNSINEGNAASFQSIPSCVDSFSSSQPQLFACVLLKILLFSSALFYCKSLSLWYNSTFHHLIYYHIFNCLNKFKFCSLCLCYIKVIPLLFILIHCQDGCLISCKWMDSLKDECFNSSTNFCSNCNNHMIGNIFFVANFHSW